jgi:hypothetical protein
MTFCILMNSLLNLISYFAGFKQTTSAKEEATSKSGNDDLSLNQTTSNKEEATSRCKILGLWNFIQKKMTSVASP